MKALFAGVMVILAAMPQGFAAPVSFADGETRYACGDDCPETQLICARDTQQAPAGIAIKDIANEAIMPLGQINYWVIAQVVADRPSDQIVDGKRMEGPALVSFGGFDWVRMDYAMQATGGGALSASLLMWLDENGLALLRCSFKPHSGADAMVEELALSLRQ